MRFFLLAFLLASCAPKYNLQDGPETEKIELASILLVDRNGLSEAIAIPDRLKSFEQINFLEHQPYQKVLRVYCRNSAGDIYAEITTYHPNGQVKQYLEVVNNRAFGTYKEWFPNGTLKVVSNIMEGSSDISLAAEKTWIFDGDCIAYNESGNLIASIPYKRGTLEGISLYYHPSGSIWKEIPYANHQICGEMKIFLESGALFSSTCFDRGIKSGKSIRYWNQDLVSSDEFYSQGKLIEGRYFSKEGQLIAEITAGAGYRAVFGKDIVAELHEYSMGLPQGEVKILNPAGHLIKLHHVKNGVKHGEELFFYPSFGDTPSKAKLSLSWYEGKIQGLVKTWHDNGVMENQREMTDGERNGVSTAWYRDGSLMMIEEYENGKLQKGDYYKKGSRQTSSQVVHGEGIVTLFDAEGNFIRKVPYNQGKPLEDAGG